MYLRNLINHIERLAPALNNRPQGSLPSNIENPKEKGKKHCKVINLRFGNDVNIPVCALKRRVELFSTQEKT